ncbi:MAG: hypothetical protein PVI13_12825 [Desulfobacterales bacterium]
MIKQGKADLMTRLRRRSDREAYILYVQPHYLVKSNNVFYLLIKNPHTPII